MSEKQIRAHERMNGDLDDRRLAPADHPSPDQLGPENLTQASEGVREPVRATGPLRNKDEGCEPLRQRDVSTLRTSANPTVPRKKPHVELKLIRDAYRRTFFNRIRFAQQARLRALAKIAFLGDPT